jgi:hypothetical protein
VDSLPDAAFTVRLPAGPALARQVFWVWLRRDCGGFVLAAVFVAVAAIALAGSYPWLSGLYTGVTLSFVGYLLRARRALIRRAEALADAEVTLRLDGYGLTFTTPDAATRVRWHDIIRVERLATMWMFRVRRAEAPTYVPTSALPPPAEAFLRGELATHGKPVIDSGLLARRPARSDGGDPLPPTA